LESKSVATKKIEDAAKAKAAEAEKKKLGPKSLAQGNDGPASGGSNPPEKVLHLDPPAYIEHYNTYWPTPRTTFYGQ
jgi:hypothetical protein